jgi:hypothetical protein
MALGEIARIEEVDEKLAALARRLSDAGRETGEAVLRRRAESGKMVRRIDTPKFADQFLAEAREALEDEVDIARPADFAEDIEPRERDREIVKKALVRLKLEQLRRIAANEELDYRGNAEEIIERIVDALNADHAAIARLILANEEPTPERGVAHRLFPIFGSTIDVGASERMLGYYARRYIRTGIARWFVFGSPERRGDAVVLDGTYRTYRVAPVEEADDSFDLTSVPDALPVSVRLDEGGAFVQARASGATESRAAAQAVMKVLGLRPWPGLPIETKPREGHLMRWDHRSVFMASFLLNELNSDGISILNLTSAHFATGETGSGADLRPSVKSVRFEGAHLLDSKPAAELLVEGRALVGISLLVRFAPNPSETFVLPIQVSLERDYVTVLTGYGTERPETAQLLQAELVKRVKGALGSPLGNESALNALAGDMIEMLRRPEPRERATFFAPDEPWGDDDSS